MCQFESHNGWIGEILGGEAVSLCLSFLDFSSPGPKVHVTFCHHLTFGVVVWRLLLTFLLESSSPKRLRDFNRTCHSHPQGVCFQNSVNYGSRPNNMAVLLKIEHRGKTTFLVILLLNYKRYRKSEVTLLLQNKRLYKSLHWVEVVRCLCRN